MIHIEDKWKGKWVLVTGGSDRVGKGICKYFAARGFNVIIHARTDRPSLHALGEELKQDYGVKVKLVTGELTNEAAVKAIFEQCSPDVVVNNAGTFKENDTKVNMAANKDAPLLVTREAIARMRADKKRGIIFFVGDGFLARGGVYPEREVGGRKINLDGYTASKTWIAEEVKRFAPLGKEGIRVLAIMNGTIETPPDTPPETIAYFRSVTNMPEEDLDPLIGGWRVGEALYGLTIAEAISAVDVPVDGGRVDVSSAPPEH